MLPCALVLACADSRGADQDDDDRDTDPWAGDAASGEVGGYDEGQWEDAASGEVDGDWDGGDEGADAPCCRDPEGQCVDPGAPSAAGWWWNGAELEVEQDPAEMVCDAMGDVTAACTVLAVDVVLEAACTVSAASGAAVVDGDSFDLELTLEPEDLAEASFSQVDAQWSFEYTFTPGAHGRALVIRDPTGEQVLFAAYDGRLVPSAGRTAHAVDFLTEEACDTLDLCTEDRAVRIARADVEAVLMPGHRTVVEDETDETVVTLERARRAPADADCAQSDTEPTEDDPSAIPCGPAPTDVDELKFFTYRRPLSATE